MPVFPARLPLLLQVLLLVLFPVLVSGAPVTAEEPATPKAVADTPLSVTEQVLDAKLKEVKSNQSLDDTTRNKLTELYDKTRSYLESIQSDQAKARSYTQALAHAADETKALSEGAAKHRNSPPWLELGVDEDTPLNKISAHMLKEKADRAAAVARLDDLSQRLTGERDRPAAIRAALTQASKDKAEVAATLNLPTPDGQATALTEALRWGLQARARMLSTRVLMLEQEILSQPARAALLKAQWEQQETKVEHLDGRIRYLEGVATQRRKVDAQQAKQEAEAAEQSAVGKNPLLGRVAEGNTALSNALEQSSTVLARIQGEDDTINAMAVGLEQDYRSARQKLEITGLSEAVGQMLLVRKRKLPTPEWLQQQVKRRKDQTLDVTLRQFQHTQDLKALRHLDQRIDELTDKLSMEQRRAIDKELMSLLVSRKDILERYLTTDEASISALSEVEVAQTRLMEAVTTLDKFLSKRLLWIRSAPAVDLDTPDKLRRQFWPLLRDFDWGQVSDQLIARSTQSPILLFGLIGVLWLRLRTRHHFRELQDLAGLIRRPSTDRFGYTVKALVLSLAIAAPWPLLLLLLGWELGQGDQIGNFSRGLSMMLLWVFPVYLHLRLFRTVCKPEGLAIAHFRWPRSATNALRRQLTVLMWTFVPASVLSGVILNLDSNNLGGEWGRLGLVLMMTLLSTFLYRLFAPGTGILHEFMDWSPGSLLARWRYLWLVVLLSLPIALAVLVLLGYTYTAVTLTVHFVDMLSLVIALLLIQQMLLRWLLVSRRRIAVRVAMDKREAKRAAAERDNAGDADSELAPIIEDADIDVVALSQDSRKLVNVALFLIALVSLWSIWKDVVPALGIFSDIDLWHRTVDINGETTQVPVTLANVILGILVLVLTAIAVKRLPALLELILLQMFDMSPGGRYTVTTLTGYVLIVGGATYVFSLLGVDWSKLQWLVAALGVGIGFGLQEIVANFISGLIILFERPIRVGDVVTIGDVDGTVTRIRIRATTIRDWDNKELLVPNKEFITSRLLNWTLSDPVMRIMTPVGIAYGSDVALATKLMLEVARENDAVMDEPASSVVFQAFGDNSLNMMLRCYIANAERRMGVISALNICINEKFNAAGINIAFPQRDVHLDTKGPLQVELRRG
jgi:potassium efflux system protein